MSRLRGRDFRAIAFCVITIAAVVAGSVLLSRNWVVAAAISGAYAIWLLTRRRMIRMMRRLRNDRAWDWSDYYRE